MAQAPMATRMRHWLRNSWSTWTFSALHTPPSTMPMSQGPQVLISVRGLRSNSMCSSSSNSRSSMSRKDMWQPKQPASEVVATLRRGAGVSMSVLLPAAGGRARGIAGRLGAHRFPVEGPLADGHAEAGLFLQNHAHRAHFGGLVRRRHVGVRQTPRQGVDDEVFAGAPPRQPEYVLAVHLVRGPHAQLAQDAAVEVEPYLGMGGIHRAYGEEVAEARRLH